jgi:REP element-mobilizing transposase RayT
MSRRQENSRSEAYQSLTHSRWNCKYHVVFVPKRRRKALFGHIRQALGPIFHELARQKECRIIEGHLMPAHMHMCIEIPPKYTVASVIGYLNGISSLTSRARASPVMPCVAPCPMWSWHIGEGKAARPGFARCT